MPATIDVVMLTLKIYIACGIHFCFQYILWLLKFVIQNSSRVKKYESG